MAGVTGSPAYRSGRIEQTGLAQDLELRIQQEVPIHHDALTGLEAAQHRIVRTGAGTELWRNRLVLAGLAFNIDEESLPGREHSAARNGQNFRRITARFGRLARYSFERHSADPAVTRCVGHHVRVHRTGESALEPCGRWSR